MRFKPCVRKPDVSGGAEKGTTHVGTALFEGITVTMADLVWCDWGG